MALAKESETFDEYSIEKRGSCVRLEKQIRVKQDHLEKMRMARAMAMRGY